MSLKIGILQNKQLKARNDYKQYKDAVVSLRMAMNSVVIKNNLNYL